MYSFSEFTRCQQRKTRQALLTVWRFPAWDMLKRKLAMDPALARSAQAFEHIG